MPKTINDYTEAEINTMTPAQLVEVAKTIKVEPYNPNLVAVEAMHAFALKHNLPGGMVGFRNGKAYKRRRSIYA